ncbi:hypothetical protein HN51_038857 [Arachis hypogaea]|uniref:Glycosyl hydrolase family 13 catalytic domain-containing protein n=1 Tax=Arachis hypogaea TaxID=3818 RepID=A0A444YH16_ARAHY|nr:isoamylase 2, chloroplastic [Arachis ipaensis]QHN84298.1 Isoamylase 2 [Arachis hypogaea]RYR01194.1 hypothetical protein Ahy_B06g080068 [Arachis hypogaea]
MANLVHSFTLIPCNPYKYRTKVSCFHKSFNQTKDQFVIRGLQNPIQPFSRNFTSKLGATSRLSVEHKLNAVASESEDLKRTLSYLFRTEIGGGLVRVYVTKSNNHLRYSVLIEVSSLDLRVSGQGEKRLVLCWGVYRDDSSCFVELDSKNSGGDAGAGMNLSQFKQNSAEKFVVELDFDAKQVPLYLSFYFKSLLGDDETSGLEIRSHRRTNFCVPVGSLPGYPAPLGLSFSPDGSMNFALFSRHAEGVVLCLYDDTGVEKPALELDLDPYVNRSGDVWHVAFESAWTFVSYGYRCRGDLVGRDKDDDDAMRVLLDPYAKIIGNFFPDGHGLVRNLGQLGKEPAFDWGDDYRPNLSMEKLVVYRLNVKCFTQDMSSQLPSNLAGTFSGLANKVKYLKDLGVNAILLEPVLTFDENKGPYFPCHFFSLMHIYGPSGDPVSTINSMKEMVKTMHANGIEVLMEVVFAHTAEAGALQGIDDLSYYFLNGVDDPDTQGALKCNYPVVQSLILDSLRHWVTEFHIDGFSFINASNLLRGSHGEYLSRPPLVEAIAFDPVLWKTKIIADSWDPHGMVAKGTHFPHWMRWAEINTKFCHDVRNFLRGESLISNLATRLCGSGDMFSNGRGPAFAFNYVARNFGLSLLDLVSFSSGELGAELSWNCGEEGPTNNVVVLERRLKQIRNFLFILFVSLGVPVLNMGDECGQSFDGSPAYSVFKPFNWSALQTGFSKQTTQFVSFLSSLRKRRSDLLQSSSFLKEENIEWYGSNRDPPQWEDPTCKFLAMLLKAEKPELPENPLPTDISGDLFLAFNAADNSETLVLPVPPEGMSWYRLVDTSLPFPGFFLTDGELVPEQTAGLFTYLMRSHSCTLFETSNKRS